jgi:SWI/SNF-related matrix-associated actin-dependent regulator of chromatin subfamily A3
MGDMSQIELKLNSGNMVVVAGYFVFGIERPSTQVVLKFPDGTEFALLNTHTAKVLNNVIDLPEVQLEAIANPTTLRETICRATKASDATLRVNINVYGSKETRTEVGRHLSAGKVYLQHPDQQRPGSIYDNPHVLMFPGIQVQSVDSKPQKIGESKLRGDDNSPFQEVVSQLYASLKRSSHLKRLEGDDRLRTTLLP